MRVVMFINTACSGLFGVTVLDYRTSSFSRPQGERACYWQVFWLADHKQIHLPGQ